MQQFSKHSLWPWLDNWHIPKIPSECKWSFCPSKWSNPQKKIYAFMANCWCMCSSTLSEALITTKRLLNPYLWNLNRAWSPGIFSTSLRANSKSDLSNVTIIITFSLLVTVTWWRSYFWICRCRKHDIS